VTPFIRPYAPADRDAVVDICVRTAWHGEDARGRVATPELYAEIWALPYLELAPDLAFVLDAGDEAGADGGPGAGAAGDGADDGGRRVLGYVMGVADTAVFRAAAERDWFPAARERHPRSASEDPTDSWLLDILHTPAGPEPEYLAPYPAHLHIDLLPEAQGGGWGRRLLETLFDALRARGVPGVHLGASDRNERAISFYKHLGMTQLATPPGVVHLALPLDPPHHPTPSPK